MQTVNCLDVSLGLRSTIRILAHYIVEDIVGVITDKTCEL